MKDDNQNRMGLLVDFLCIGRNLAKLATSYLLLIREQVKEDAKIAGRRTALTAALLFVFVIGMVLFSVGLSKVVETWIGTEGTGYVAVGGFMILLLPIAVLIFTRRG